MIIKFIRNGHHICLTLKGMVSIQIDDSQYWAVDLETAMLKVKEMTVD